jgi:multiple sugar transport system permease protein
VAGPGGSATSHKGPKEMQSVAPQGAQVARWVLALPLLIFLTGLLVVPIYLGVKTAFSYDLLSDFDIYFNGLDNFYYLLTDSNFWISLRFTLLFAIFATTLQVIAGFGLAIVFDRKIPGKKILFSIILIPIMIAPSLLAVMFRLILNENIGIVPGFLNIFGLSISLFSQTTLVPLLILLDFLQFTPFTFLLFYSALQNVPDDLYESAELDGASYAKTIRKIILPVITPAIVVIALLRFLESIRNFDVIYILTGGGPGISTQTIGIYIYKTAFLEGDFGLASSAAVILVLLLAPFTPWVIKKLTSSQANS